MIYLIQDGGEQRPATPEEAAQLDADAAEAVGRAAAALAQERQDYIAEVRDLRERILNRLAGIAAAAVATSDTATLDAFVLARQKLLDITKDAGVVNSTTIEDLRAAMKAAYLGIVLSTPPGLRGAFEKVDA